MLIQEKPLKHWIDNFYGYGSWDAKIWFVAYEDGGGDLPEEVAQRLNYFNATHSGSPALCDIRELFRHVTLQDNNPKAAVYSNLFEYRFDTNAVQSSVWKNLTAFVHGYKGASLPDMLTYQQHAFLSPELKSEALIQLYPLPSPHNHAWYYSWLDMPQFSFLKSRALYQEHLYHARIRTILQNIVSYRPEVVLFYGMDNINILKLSIQDVFPSVKFKMVKAIKLLIPQHHITEVDGTKIVVTTQIPTLRHNRIESGFDWQQLGINVATNL